MQSGLKKTKDWIVEFEFDSTLKKDVLMGWNSSGAETIQSFGDAVKFITEAS